MKGSEILIVYQRVPGRRWFSPGPLHGNLSLIPAVHAQALFHFSGTPQGPHSFIGMACDENALSLKTR